MGIRIFLAAVVVEIIFAFLCISTRSNQQRVRSIIRIGAFVCFVLLSIFSVLEWSLRYYSLATLLLFLATLGTVSLIHKGREKRSYKTSRVIFKAIGMTLLIFLFALPSILFPQHEMVKPTGEYQVTTATYSYTDTKRSETYSDNDGYRVLNVEMWFPKSAEGTFPLIVFSHGAFGIRTSNTSLYHELASHGYVVCSIDHTYQCLYTRGEEGHTILMDKGYVKELSDENAYVDKQQSYEFYQKWMKIRTGDMNFVIDTILAKVQVTDTDTVYKRIDTTKIGVMGHSLGGSAALGIGRERSDISAVIALESPFMCDITGVEKGAFVFTDAIYPVPVLNVYSDQGWGLLASAPHYAENYALLSTTNANAFSIHISGVGHLTLTDLALESPILTRLLNGKKSTTGSVYCLKTINEVCLDFFDSYVKDKHNFTSTETCCMIER